MQSVTNTNGQPELHANGHSDGYGHRDSNSHGDGNGYRHSHGDGDSHRDFYANTKADTYAEDSPVTETSSDTAATTLSGSGRLIVHCAAGIDRSRLRVFGKIPGRNPPHPEWRAATMRTSTYWRLATGPLRLTGGQVCHAGA